jgi:hypothetical protein
MWAPGELTITPDERADYGWDFTWDGFKENLDEAWDDGSAMAEDGWNSFGEPIWNFVAGDAINACADDPTSDECGIEALALLPPFKFLKARKLERFREWWEKLRGRDAPSPKVKPSPETPTTISGLTEHGKLRIMGRDGGRGVSDHAMDDAVLHPVKRVEIQQSSLGPKFKYVGKDATVILNQDGRVITAYATNRNGFRNP